MFLACQLPRYALHSLTAISGFKHEGREQFFAKGTIDCALRARYVMRLQLSRDLRLCYCRQLPRASHFAPDGRDGP